MPTRKQKRRDLKSKRHDYEFVYVDSDGNELDEAPEELVEQKKERTNGAKPAAATASKKKPPAQRGRRIPQPPSWRRAAKRSALFGVALVVLFSLGNKGNLARALPTAIAFTLFYIPIMYYIDRMAYRRWEARQQGGGTTPTKKR